MSCTGSRRLARVIAALGGLFQQQVVVVADTREEVQGQQLLGIACIAAKEAAVRALGTRASLDLRERRNRGRQRDRGEEEGHVQFHGYGTMMVSPGLSSMFCFRFLPLLTSL